MIPYSLFTTQHLFVTLKRLFVTVVWKNFFFIGIFDVKIYRKTSDFGENREKRRRKYEEEQIC